MKNQVVIHIANYAAPYKGNFIASLEVLEQKLEESGNNRMVYIFPEQCKNVNWIKEFTQKKRGGRVKFIPSPTSKLFLNKNLIAVLESIFNEEKPAIIHSHFDGYDEYVVRANKVGAHVIWHYHNPRTLVQNPLKKAYQIVMLHKQYHIVGKNVNIIILGSGFQRDLERFCYRKKAFLLPNGIHEERISYSNKNPSNIISFLNFGGRADHKGIDILLDAVVLLKKKNLRFKVRITDGVDTINVMHQYFGENIPSEIEIVPQTENVECYFHENDWFISASRRETFSYAIAEAMLSGTPILSSDIEGVRWAFNQPSVIKFESENSVSLADRMEEIITGKIIINEQNLKQARKFVLKNYTADVWAEKLLQYYDNLYEEER